MQAHLDEVKKEAALEAMKEVGSNGAGDDKTEEKKPAVKSDGAEKKGSVSARGAKGAKAVKGENGNDTKPSTAQDVDQKPKKEKKTYDMPGQTMETPGKSSQRPVPLLATIGADSEREIFRESA